MVYVGRVLSLFGLLQAVDGWSFKEFMVGDWDLERRNAAGQTDRAHYSLQAVGTQLEGSYYEEADGGRVNEMAVRILFDDDSSGQFQLAKMKPPAPAAAEDDEPPQPQPQPEPKTAFEFDFHKQNGDYFHLSDSKWLGRAGGTVQFLAMEDAFVFTKMACSGADGQPAAVQASAWTAVRVGAPRRAAAAAERPRSLLQRYGWYIFFAALYCLYHGGKAKVAAAAGGMKKAQ